MRIVSLMLLLAGLFWVIYSLLNLCATALPYPDSTPELLKVQTEQVRLWQYSLLASGLATTLGGLGIWKFRGNDKPQKGHGLGSET